MNSTAEMAKTMRMLVENPSIAEEIGARARKKDVIEEHSSGGTSSRFLITNLRMSRIWTKVVLWKQKSG